jgi:conjugative relaxase-like TrwC/TraI family protein
MAVRVTTLKGAGAGVYYTRELELGRYYIGDEERGRWFGRQADALGLGGDIDPQTFLRLMSGLDPVTESCLGRAYGESSARGYDVTFNAPKSVSLLAELCPTVQADVLAAHDAAVEQALRFVERQAHTRVTVQQVTTVVDTQGLCVGLFRQHTSRAGDPHLHTHAVVVAKVRDERGRWYALDGRMIKHDQRTLSALYHAGLRAGLTRRLGVEWEVPVNGIAELTGLDDRVLARFSTRTDQLETRVQDKLDRFRVTFGRDPQDRERWRLEREAAVDSRPGKHVHTRDQQQAAWQSELAALGVTPRQLVDGTIGRQLTPTGITRPATAQIVTAAQAELVETVSTWRRNDVIREIARRIPTAVTVDPPALIDYIEQAADNVIGRHIELAPPAAAHTPLRRDGRPVTESTLDRRYTTEQILTEEEFLLTWALDRQLVPGTPAVLADPMLDRAQLAAARAAAGSSNLVVIIGPAGTGKTSALRTAAAQLRRNGRAVFGLAPSATAATVLGDAVGVEADTVDKLLHEHRHGYTRPRYALDAGTTLLVDEAGMIPTPKLAALARLADEQQWRIVLIGDARQLGAVGRSGMFAELAERGQVIELDQVHRFRSPWEATASLQLRRGDPDALDAYEAHGRISGGTRIEMQRATLEHWAMARAPGDRVIMLAVTHDTVTELNHAAQTIRARDGHLDMRRSAAAADGVVYVGDEIVTRANNRHLLTHRGVPVRNRAHWTVTGIHPDGSVVARNRDGIITLPAPYAATSVELGYAQTVHAAQGVTVDRCLLVIDGPVDGRAVYVGLTRGRDANHAYVAVEGNHAARDTLERALAGDWTDRPAIAVRADLHHRPVMPFGRPAPAFLATGDLRALRGEQRDLRALDIVGHERRVDELHARHADGSRRLDAARAERRVLTGQLTDVSTQRAILGRIGHRHERGRLDARIDHLNQGLSRASSNIDTLEHRLADVKVQLDREQQQIDEHPDASRRLRDVESTLGHDLAARGHAIAVDPPAYLTAELGPVPSEPHRRLRWEHVAGKIEQHRAEHRITDPHRALGIAPVPEPAQQLAERRLQQQALQVRDAGLRHTPDLGRSLGPTLGF